MVTYQYIKDPAEIYRRSFAAIEAEVDLSRLPLTQRPIAQRLIHTGGMVDLIQEFGFSTQSAEAGRRALMAGADIICDVEMVASGITRRFLPKSNRVICALNDPQTPLIAARDKTTRSAAAMDVLAGQMDGAIVAVGNAPTALFRILELVRDTHIAPALIIGMPVGFVGAAESKRALADNPFNLEFITVHGRCGGSAYTAATVNALALGEH